MPESSPQRQNFEIQVPLEIEAGSYANMLSVWHSPFEFTLDFSVTLPPTLEDADTDEPTVNVPCRVVSRVKLPPTVMFDVLRALNENMTRFESTYGMIQRPAPGEEPRDGDDDR